MKALKAPINPFEAPQTSVKIKIWLDFFSLFGIWTGKVNFDFHADTLLKKASENPYALAKVSNYKDTNKDTFLWMLFKIIVFILSVRMDVP